MNRKQRQRLKILLSLNKLSALKRVTFCLAVFSFSNAIANLPPRLSVNGYTSDYTVGQIDAMLPISSDYKNSDNLYIDPQFAYATDNQGYADLGFGYRAIVNQAAILGGYLFGGYTRANNNARLWVINPGVEALGSRWDAHLNIYIPLGDQHYALPIVGFAGFSGHSQINNLYQQTQYVGNGSDIKLAYQLFKESSLKGYIGSYYFDIPQTTNIWGGAAGLEYWFQKELKVFAAYTYDKYNHGTGAIGLGLELGGTHIHRQNPTLQERLTDPVDRYLAELGKGSHIPSKSANKSIGVQLTSLTNIAFFSQNGQPNDGGGALTLANCTFENPCGPTDFSQMGVDTLNTLLPNTMMYFNGGTYASSTGTSITLNDGQSMQSRTADYMQPVSGADRSIFNAALRLGNKNLLDGIILLSTATTSGGTGLTINTTDNIVQNSQIGSVAHPFSIGIFTQGTGANQLKNSEIFSFGGGNTGGIFLFGTPTLTVENSTINSNQRNAGVLCGPGSPTAILINSVVNAVGDASSVSGIDGLDSRGSGQIIASNTTVTVNTPFQARAIATNLGGNINFSNGTAISNGNNTSVIATGVNAQITNSTCILNGTVVTCP